MLVSGRVAVFFFVGGGVLFSNLSLESILNCGRFVYVLVFLFLAKLVGQSLGSIPIYQWLFLVPVKGGR